MLCFITARRNSYILTQYFMMDTRKRHLFLIAPAMTVICSCLAMTEGVDVHRKFLFQYHDVRVRLKRNSEVLDTNGNITREGGNVLCNKDTQFSCKCMSCDESNSDDNTNSGVKCCDLILEEFSSDFLRIVFKRDASMRNESITEEQLKTVVASALQKYCEPFPSACNLIPGAHVTGIFPMTNVLVSRIAVNENEQIITLIVIIPKDTYNKNAVMTSNSESDSVSYPVNYLRSALKNQVSLISERLGMEVKSISLGLNMPSADTLSTESYTVTTEYQMAGDDDDLNVTGVVFGGIFAFLFLLTCFASARKAVK